MPDALIMKLAELLRRLKRLASRNGWDIRVQEGANLTKVILRGRRTVVSRHATDLKTGTLRSILNQLGVSAEDLDV